MTTINLPRATVEQALEALAPWMDSDHTVQHAAYHALRTALAKQRLTDTQQEMERSIESLKAALAQQAEEPYAGKAARLNNDRVQVDPVTGNVSIGAEQAEPLGWAVQIGTHSAGRRQGKPRYVLFFNKADAEALADRTRGARPEPFYLEGQPSRTVPVYTAPPQRKPLTDEGMLGIIDAELEGGSLLDVARAIERAHGITGDPK